jgi:hypothetical protein
MDNVSPLLTEREAAVFLRRSLSSLRRGRKSQIGPSFVRFGRSIRYRLVDLQGYIEANRKSVVWGVPRE